MRKIRKKKIPLKLKRLDEVSETDFKELITESCTVYNWQTGLPEIVYIENAANLNALADALQKIKYSKSGRTGGLPTVSRVFGYQPRITIRRDFCNSASLNTEEPSVYSMIKHAGQIASKEYLKNNKLIWGKHMSMTNKLMDTWRIPETPFTSGIINKNNQLRYHYDSGNFKDVWSAMFVFKRSVEGGHISIPDYDIGFELKHNSLFLFDGQSILHGVTPIKLLSPYSYRISMVYYSLIGMWKCESMESEIKRISRVKTEREEKRI